MVKLGAKLSRKTYRSKFFDDYCMFFVKYFGTVIFVHSASPGVSFAAGMHLECGLSCGETWLFACRKAVFCKAECGKRETRWLPERCVAACRGCGVGANPLGRFG